MNKEQLYFEHSLEREDLVRVLGMMQRTGIFNSAYLDKKFVLFGKDKKLVFERGLLREADGDESAEDFMQGKRTDFIGIESRDEYEGYDRSELSDIQFLPSFFLEKIPTYEEFVAHETAHNVFDEEYKTHIGEFVERNGATDVSNEYRNAFRETISGLIEKYYPGIEARRFSYSRQQIAEIFATLYEREFCKRARINQDVHEYAAAKAKKFSDAPKKALEEFNDSNGRHCTLDDFYQESHVLSFVAAPIIEKEFPDFEQRRSIFWKAE